MRCPDPRRDRDGDGLDIAMAGVDVGDALFSNLTLVSDGLVKCKLDPLHV